MVGVAQSVIKKLIEGTNMKQQTKAILFAAMVFAALIFMTTFRVQAQSDKMPAPDFSEMEKYYEIVKWTYTDDGIIKMIIKPKSNPPQIHHLFTMRFFDEDGIDLQYKYNICCPGYNAPAGQVERVETPAPEESKINKVKTVIAYRILDDGTLIGPKPSESQKENSAQTRQKEVTRTKTGTAETKVGVNGNQAADCNYDAQPSLDSNARFSAALAKSALYGRYSFEKDTGGLSSPLAVGVTFLNLQVLNFYTNTVTVVSGRGAQRKHDGAPVGATVYRFHAKYIVCRKYSDSTRRTQYESDNVCFKAKNGNWDCPIDSVPQITELE